MMRRGIIVAPFPRRLMTIGSACAAAPAQGRARVYWPTNDWRDFNPGRTELDSR